MIYAPETLDWFKRFESFRATPYVDRGGALAIGYGHSNKAGTLPVVVPGMVITEAQAHEILLQDMQHFWDQIKDSIKVEVNPWETGALILFSYNVGGNAFKKSTLLKLLNQGDRKGAAAQFMKWTKSEGQTLDGLIFRRAQEMCLFRHGWWE